MKREIKFRFWNIIVEKMQYFDLPDIEKQKGVIQWHIIDIMQFTGLKDKNGKGIYEGDIVKWGHLSGSYEDPVRIATVSINPDISFTLIPSVDPRQHVFRYGNFAYKKTELALEIIGNIHEHPELIKP